jgi:hypothetical protein
MSYSFTFTSDTKNSACNEMRARIDSEVERQPAHEFDKAAIIENAERVIMLLPESPGEGCKVSVSMNGSVGGHWGPSGLEKVTSVTISCSAGWYMPQS